MVTFPVPAHRTTRADFPHAALGRDHAYYLRNSFRLKARSELPDILQQESFRGYDRLSVKELDRRLAEEHERATVLDDKTLKVTLFLSAGFSVLGLGLTIIGSSSSPFMKTADPHVGPILFTGLFGVSVVYFLLASWLALGAVRTYPRFGFGTQYLLVRQHSDSTAFVAEHLARQETFNVLRHCRNEAVFQTVRNGLILLLVGIVAFPFYWLLG